MWCQDKIGFDVSTAEWVQPLTPLMNRIVGSETMQRIPAFEQGALIDHWHRIRAGELPFDKFAWRWMNTVIWVDRFGVKFD